jgi:hypothetical protein
VWEASNVDIAFQKGPAVVPFPAARRKKKMREHLVNMLCAQRPCVLAAIHGATTPIKGKKNRRAHLRL